LIKIKIKIRKTITSCLACFLACFIVLSFSGCASSQNLTNKAHTWDIESRTRISPGRTVSHTSPPQNNVSEVYKTIEARAEKLEQEIEKLPDIENAAVIISGNSAIVGIVLESDDTGDNELIGIKTEISRAVKALDAEIDHVSVSAAAELYDRITKLNANRTPKEQKTLDENHNKNLPFPVSPTL